MKRRVLALALCLALLPSCAAMLEREYTVASPHEEDPAPHTGAAYRVETYPALRSALLSYVEEGMAEGRLRLPTTYPGNLAVDLEKAKRQLMEEEPLGCYGLSDLTWHTSKIIAYYEVDLAFTYRVDPKELVSLPKARSQSELARLLEDALGRGESRLVVYLTACPEDDTDFCDQALVAAWKAVEGVEDEEEGQGGEPGPDQVGSDQLPPPDQAPEPGGEGEADDLATLPQMTVTFYPQTGTRRVAQLEILPTSAGDGDG